MTHDLSGATATVAVTALAACTALGAPGAQPVVTARDVGTVTSRADALSEQLHRTPELGEYASAGVPSVMLQLGVAAVEKVAAAKQGGPPLVPIHSGKFLPARPDSLRNAILVETNAVLTFLPVKTR